MQITSVAVPPSVTTYVNNGNPMSLSSLLSAYPASAAVLGMYAHVTNLYGTVDDILRCRFDGTNYNWVPQRESATGTTATNSGNIPFVPLFTPTTLIMTATALAGNVSVALSNTYAYNGQPAEVVTQSNLGLGVYAATITGLLGSNVSLLAGQTRRFRFGSGGWYLLP